MNLDAARSSVRHKKALPAQNEKRVASWISLGAAALVI